MDSRGTFSGKPAPGPFVCLGCKTYVTGTPSGHCPRCGFVPPAAPIVPEPVHRRVPVHATLVLLAILLIVLLRLV